MDKQQVIAFIEGQLALGVISRVDLAGLAHDPAHPQTQYVSAPIGGLPLKESNPRNLTNILYGIGAIIAIVGVGILIAQNWNEIGFAGRMLVTVGISFVAYALGLVFRSPEQRSLSQVMFTVSAVLAPLGAFVLMEEANIDFTWSAQFTSAAILFVLYATALVISKRNILVLVAMGFASWAYYALLLNIISEGVYDELLLKWATILLGASLIAIGSGYRALMPTLDLQDDKEKRKIQNVLYGFGTLAVLGAGMSLGGIYDLVMIAVIFAAFYGSVYLKSRMMLVLGALFMMAHIIKLTSEYFVDSIGWPIALIGVGFLTIGIGYGTFYLNRTYITAK